MEGIDGQEEFLSRLEGSRYREQEREFSEFATSEANSEGYQGNKVSIVVCRSWRQKFQSFWFVSK